MRGFGLQASGFGRASRGFTLVELTVALAAGLVVALGIVGLSKEATRTFHEEVRSSAAEAALRTAVDRLRADLQRASSMSTGNIWSDPKIAKSPGWTSNVQLVPAGMAGLRRLAGVHLFDGGSFTNTQTLSAVQNPALDPDAIEIGGNMSSDEQYVVVAWQPQGSCERLMISTTSAAAIRLMAVGAAMAPIELRNQFQPVPPTLATQFLVRIVDETGHTQYVPTCSGESSAASFSGTQPYVDVDAAPFVQAGSGFVGGVGQCGGRCTVNPVQIVRWELMSPAQEPAQYVNGLDGLSTNPTAPDPNKYDLVRTYVDASGNPVPQTSEVVAEYAVDLDFAFTVDQGDATGQNPSLLTYTFDDGRNANWAYDVSSQAPALPGQPAPERIRSIRFRLVTRASLADRTVNIPVANYGTQDFLYRYCLVPPCATQDDVLRWARARTITTEVSIPNQQKDFY